MSERCQRGFLAGAFAVAAAIGSAAATPAAAQTAPDPAPGASARPLAPSPAPPQPATPQPALDHLSIHAQTTMVQQYLGNFPAAYSGTNSLFSRAATQKTVDAALYLGFRPWKTGEFYVNPELDQGFGLGNPGAPGQPYNGTFGVAGFVSGQAYKVGRDSSYGRIQRAFFRQQINFSGDRTEIANDINQLGEPVSSRRLTLTAGKFGVTDIFDTNVYAHDPNNDFLNWSVIEMGAFDYAADAWGYTDGISAESYSPGQVVRAGIFQLSSRPNDVEIEHQPLLQYSPVIEYERDTSFFGGRPGAIKALVYGDDGYFGPYSLAVSAAAGTGLPPSTASVRARYMKVGGGLNISQEVAPHIGVFARASAMNGSFEADEFTDIDRSLSAGVSIAGALFRRPNDAIGLAGAVNAISTPAQQYFAAGGLGLLIGDGALSYGAEQIFEAYYRLGITKGVGITADYQHVTNPAYNVVRGPVSVFGLRYHAQI